MADDGSQSAARRKLMVRASEWGMTRDERIEFAEQLLRRDVESWVDLDEDQVRRLLDGFEGCELLMEIVRQRGLIDV